MQRRDFLRLMGLASGSALIPSCDFKKETEKLIPYLLPPEKEIIPGQPFYYSTTCTECPANCGLSVRVCDKTYKDKRGIFPVKLEGIADHPVNNGALCIRGQSSLTRLYHPGRIKNPVVRDSKGNFINIEWTRAYSMIADSIGKFKKEGYRNIYLTGRTTGSFSDLIDLFCKKTEVERVPEFELLSHANLREANRILFNIGDIPSFHIEKADYLLTIGADILETFVSPVSNAVGLSQAKRKSEFRWHHIEPHLSLTGLQANDRFAIEPASEIYFLTYLLKAIHSQKFFREKLPEEIIKSLPDFSDDEVSKKTGIRTETLQEIAEHLKNSKTPLLITGGVSTAHSYGFEAEVLSGLLQWTMGMTGSTVDFSRTGNYSGIGTMLEIERLLSRLNNNEIGIFFLAGIETPDGMPHSSLLKKGLKKAKLRVGISDFSNNTIRECDIVLPLSNVLESWADAEPRKGLITLIQPALEPLLNTASHGDILLSLLKATGESVPYKNYQEHLFSRWKEKMGGEATKEFLSKGYYEKSLQKEKISVNEKSAALFLKNIEFNKDISKPLLLVTPSVRSFDGRSRVLQILNDIPDPLTTISYGEWISVPEKSGESKGLKDTDEIEIGFRKAELKLPAKILQGLPEGIYTVYYESLMSGQKEFPFDVDKRTGETICYFDKIKTTKTELSIPIPILSGSTSQEGRGIVPHPVKKEKFKERRKSLYPKPVYPDYRWAMAIDLELCIACSACVAACYIENNIPVTSKREHLMGLEMSWIRIEPFYDENRKWNFILMLCQQCDYAPCEPVCPVYASYHNPEGLNVQVYNRCVGTRYCSNNCPYKVRRFNWFDHILEKPSSLIFNPDVFVRTKGIMEKCTFCIQRIRLAHDTAKDESRKIRDGEIMPACAQTCPAGAISFGNILDKESRIYKLAHSERAYRIFESLGTEPAVYYLRRNERRKET